MATGKQSISLTERRIRDAKPGPKTIIIWDVAVKGFGLRVTPAGAKAFILNYRSGGRERRYTIGRVGEISLADAREIAGRELVAIRTGESDPLRDRQAAKVAPTVADGLDHFIDVEVPRRRADGLMSERTAYTYGKQCAWLKPRLGSLKIADVTRHDIERALANVAPVSRNRYLAILGRLFTYWQRLEWCQPGHNPARLIEKTRETPRDRVLAPSEIGALGAALSDLDNMFTAAALRFLIMTGWRNGEALSLRWKNVDLDTGEIVLPTTKTGRDRRTVGTAALDVLASLPTVNGNPFVFAGERGAAISYKTLHSAFKRACAAAGIADANLHDLRRTMATSAAETMTLTGLRDLLNHKTTTMAARYARRSDNVLQAAQDNMASKMAAMLDGGTAEVVPLRRRDA